MRLIIVICLLSVSTNCFSQFFKYSRWGLLAGYNYDGNYSPELGLVRGLRCSFIEGEPCELFAENLIYSYFSLSSELKAEGANLTVVPKLGYHYVLGFVSFGGNVYGYKGRYHNEIGIRPEIGLSLGGAVNLNYGYSLGSSEYNQYAQQNFNLSIIFGSGLVRDLYKKKNSKN